MFDEYRNTMDRIILSKEADVQILYYIRQEESALMKGKNSSEMRNRKKGIIKYIVAALVSVLLFGSGAYAISTRISMSKNALDDGVEIQYESIDDAYIELGIRYPSNIPDDYEVSFVSDPIYGSQTVNYLNAEGNYIRYIYTKAGNGFSAELKNIAKEITVQIGENYGILYSLKNGSSVLFWTDDFAGIGYMLDTDEKDLDLTTIAESVSEHSDALKPTYALATKTAMEELGDHDLTFIPDNFISAGTAGCPKSMGGDWYAYVRRVYVNKSTNTELILTYESYRVDYMENTAENILSLGGNGDDITVNGMPGRTLKRITGNSVYWVDTDNCIRYMLYSAKISMDDLVTLAQHVN